jgi:hypothetical protein
MTMNEKQQKLRLMDAGLTESGAKQLRTLIIIVCEENLSCGKDPLQTANNMREGRDDFIAGGMTEELTDAYIDVFDAIAHDHQQATIDA